MATALNGVLQRAMTTVFGQGQDTIVLKVAQTYYAGNAQFKVMVDGQQVGGIFSVSATTNSGDYDTVTLKGDWGAGAHNIQLVYLNDTNNVATGQDRNLLIGDVALNGTSLNSAPVWAWSNGAKSFTGTIAAPSLVVTGTAGADTLKGGAGDDIITGGRGNDVMTGNGGHDLYVLSRGDGWDTIKDFSATGVNSDVVRLSGYMISSFAELKGRMVQSGADTLLMLDNNNQLRLSNVQASTLTAANFQFVNAVAVPKGVVTTTGTGADSLVLKLSQDYFAGDNAKFTISVDGVQVGGVFSASAVRLSGQQDVLTLNGNWGAGDHTVSVKLLNDNFNAVTLEDRNLMIESATMNGSAIAGATQLITNSNVYSFFAKVAATTLAVGAGPSAPLAAPALAATHDVFDYVKGVGNKVISTFSATGDDADILRIDGYGAANGAKMAVAAKSAPISTYTSFDDLKSHIVQSGADTVIQLSATDSITLKNVKASDLTADNFSFASKLGSAMQYATNNGWIVFNNTWGSDDLKEGKDYSVGAVYDVNKMTTGTTFTWNYAAEQKYSYTKVLGYPSVMYGSDTFNNARGEAVDTAKALPVQVRNLDKLTSGFSVSMGGDTKGFDVAYDIWLTNKPNGTWADITNEVMIWLHRGDANTYGALVGTYTDGNYSAKIYHTGTYTALVPDKDYPAGTVDIADVFKKLQALGIVSDKEYVNQIDLGAEPFKGAGSLTINKLTYDITSHDENGIVTYDHADGGVTKVTKTGTAGADTIDTGSARITTLHGGAGNDTFVFTKGQSGAVTIDDFHTFKSATAEHDVLTFTGYGAGATLTHDSGDVWTVHYAGGDDQLILKGVTSLSANDYHFI